MSRVTRYETYTDVVRAIVQQPRTINEIATLCGCLYGTARDIVLALVEGGLVYRTTSDQMGRRGGTRPFLYHWCPVPFEMPASLREAA